MNIALFLDTSFDMIFWFSSILENIFSNTLKNQWSSHEPTQQALSIETKY